MIDKRLLDTTVEVEILEKEADLYGKQAYKAPITLEFCRLDESTGDTGSSNAVSRDYTSVIVFYPKYTPVTVTDDWLGARITDIDTGKRFTLKRWLPNKLAGRVFSYELELE